MSKPTRKRPGNRARAISLRVEVLDPGAAGISKEAEVVVPTVTVLVWATDEPLANVTEAGANVQDIPAGTPMVPHVMVTVPVKPPTGVSVSVLVPAEPCATLIDEGVKAACTAGATTV